MDNYKDTLAVLGVTSMNIDEPLLKAQPYTTPNSVFTELSFFEIHNKVSKDFTRTSGQRNYDETSFH